MAIKPVDFQVMIPRTMEAAKISNDITQRNLAAQQQQASAMQHKSEDSLKQVYSRNQAQDVHISEKQKENSKGRGKRKRGDQTGAGGDDEKNRNRLTDEIKTSTIDIKI